MWNLVFGLVCLVWIGFGSKVKLTERRIEDILFEKDRNVYMSELKPSPSQGRLASPLKVLTKLLLSPQGYQINGLRGDVVLSVPQGNSNRPRHAAPVAQPNLRSLRPAAKLEWRRRAHSPFAVIWSDSKAVEDYKLYIEGKSKFAKAEDGPSVIVGRGRIGSMLKELGEKQGFDDLVIGRGDVIPADHPGPVYVCTPIEDVPAVIASCPEEKHDDLVFLQDGDLTEIFRANSMYGQFTQASLWLATHIWRPNSRPYVSGAGLNTVYGKWAEAFCQRMHSGDLECEQAPDDKVVQKNRMEKLVFRSAYNLVGVVAGAAIGKNLTYADVASQFAPEVGQLCRELAAAMRSTKSITVKTGLDERLNDYASSLNLDVDMYKTKLRDFDHTNAYFLRISKMSGKRKNAAGVEIETPDFVPTHSAYLNEAVELGIIPQELIDSVTALR